MPNADVSVFYFKVRCSFFISFCKSQFHNFFKKRESSLTTTYKYSTRYIVRKVSYAIFIVFVSRFVLAALHKLLNLPIYYRLLVYNFLFPPSNTGLFLGIEFLFALVSAHGRFSLAALHKLLTLPIYYRLLVYRQLSFPSFF